MDFQKEIELIEKELAHLALNDREPNTLYAPMAYIMGLGGKRIRPLVALLTYRSYQPSGELAEIIPVMRAIELFHNFTLLHDDVMDDAPLRRGKPTVYKKWGANTAILSGDGMLVEAYKQLQDLSKDKLPEALKLFNSMAIAVCEGQQYDMDFEQRDLEAVSLEDYVAMIRLKTSFLFCGAVSLGAYIGNAPEKDRLHLWKAIELMGLAFQIKDDYLDLFGKANFGKKLGGDIEEGKKTWLLIKAYKKDKKALLSALSIEDMSKRIEQVTKLYREEEIDKEALQEVERLSVLGKEELQKLSIGDEAIQPLQQLFMSLVNRDV